MRKSSERIKMARRGEAEAVRTTIVGGRPPGGGANVGDVPRGVEVLIKKAAVDPAFKKMLLEKGAGAAEAIALKLEPAEAAMLDAVPLPQLEAIVANTKVSPKLRPAFLGYAAVVMLAALGVVTVGSCTKGHAPDIPNERPSSPPDVLDPSEETTNKPDIPDERPSGPPDVLDPSEETTKKQEKGDELFTKGIRPDKP
jgi:hypothetical protein